VVGLDGTEKADGVGLRHPTSSFADEVGQRASLSHHSDARSQRPVPERSFFLVLAPVAQACHAASLASLELACA